MERLTIPPALAEMNAVFAENGFSAYLVGGAVRDMLRGKAASDWDVATSAWPDDVRRLFRRVIPTGIEHGTVTVLFRGRHIEVTTFRTESDYADGRHPGRVGYADAIESDLSRRDFTINAIAASLSDGRVVDPFDGRADIARKIIRTVGRPEERFAEDGLRPVRAIRFAAALDFAIQEETLAAIPRCLDKTRLISIERFRDEFVKMLGAEEPSIALKLMERTGVLSLFVPELADCRGVEQRDCRGRHWFDVLDHLFYACDGAPRDNLVVRLAALFHGVGREQQSAALCKTILTRLRFPNQVIDAASHLVTEHMFHYEPAWTDAAVRRFIVRVTPEALPDLFDLRIADCRGMTGPWAENLAELKDRVDAALSQKAALSLKDLAVSGNDLIAEGIPPGRLMGNILKELLETVLDNPAENEREHLLEIARNRQKRQSP
jgi:tRNA nucleotidyltransferase/poly(A) polymerase